MEPVNLIAIKSLKYAGTRLRPGDRFTATRAHAKAFVKALKKAKYADAPPVVLEVHEHASRDAYDALANAEARSTVAANIEVESPVAATPDLETYETKVEQPDTEPPVRSRRHRSRT